MSANEPKAWARPSKREVDAAVALIEPWRRATAPVFHGLEHIPATGPALLIGNHSTYAWLDMPLMALELHRSRGRWVRGIADRLHYRIPGWRDVMTRVGGVEGTRENCRALLAAGEAVLVYPGGAREVHKRKNERYQLIWKERLGFARMAVEAGCPIVPFGAVGAEDAFDIIVDADSPLLAPLRPLVERIVGGRSELPPLSRGIGPTPFPRPERLYFAFGEPIDTRPWAGRHNDENALREVRDRTRDAVEALIAELLVEQEHDPQRKLAARLPRRPRR